MVPQSQSCNLQDVEIRLDNNLGPREGDLPHRQWETSPLERQSSIQDRLTIPHGISNSPTVPVPQTQVRTPLSLRLGERVEDQREVSLSRTGNKRKVGRGVSTSRGRGRGRGSKVVPLSPLVGVGSKKRNVLRTHAPSKKKLCMDTQITRSSKGTKDGINNLNVPLNEEEYLSVK